MSMPEELLFSISEMALALIGFSGVVTALGHRKDNSWSAAEILQLRTLVEPAASAMFGAFLPSILGLVISSDETLWRLCNGLLFGIVFLPFGAFWYRASSAKIVPSQIVMSVVTVLVLVLMSLSALGVIEILEFTFLLGLILCLVVGVHNFALLLFKIEDQRN